MADTFSYKNRKGTYEQLPTKPSFFQKAYENAAYPDDVDAQRAAANKGAENTNGADKDTTKGTFGSADDR